jgi:hypothetical protein
MSTQSSQPPTSDQLTATMATLVRPEQRRYFFDNLENAAWVKPLAESGFFTDPPDPIRDEERGTIAPPTWPESRYLARMAQHAPQDVSDVIHNIRPTQNSRVHEDFLDAALAMPPDIAKSFVQDVIRWITEPNGLLVPDKVGRLITHLANEGEVDAALRLARETLRLVLDPRPVLSPEPAPRFNEWEYGEILRRRVPVLVTAAGLRALTMLCNLLNSAVRLSVEEGDRNRPEDYSYIWRRAVEEHAQNGPGGVKSLLVPAVRDAALSIIEADPSSVRDVIATIEGFNWNIFRRIALYLLARKPAEAPDLVSAHLCERATFSNAALRHEYAALLGKTFDSLEPEQQQTVLNWISDGPDPQLLRSRFETESGLDEEAVAQYVRVWTRDRLSWIGDALPPEWAQRYKELVDAFGQSEHSDFPSWTSGTLTGPNSPKTASELNSMPAIEVVRFLSKWRPDEDAFMGPSHEGLGRELSSAVAAEPARYSLVATNFRGLDPTYVRSLVSGFRDALNAHKAFEWPPILALCRSIVETSWDIATGDRRLAERDLDWSPTHQAIAELLSAGFDANMSMDLRPSAWAVLAPLTLDPEPTPEYEERYGGSNMDPLTLSINTARGAAIHGVVRYALWVRRALDHGQHRTEPSSLDALPEVREVLEYHLNPQADRSLAVRAVYGRWLPWLVLLDREWARTHLEDILPSDPTLRVYWDAAWETYIFYSQLYDDTFELLRHQYAEAVERIGTSNPALRRRADPDGRLGEHLMVMYWRGKLSLATDDMVGAFFERASALAREHALGFVGRIARGTADTLDQDVQERLELLWNSRLLATQNAVEASNYIREMAAFGWWFTSGKFKPEWSLTQLLSVLRLGAWPEPDQWVVEQLAGLVLTPALTADVVECLSLLVHGDKEGWHTYGWRDHAKAILLRGVSSDDPQVRKTSADLANWLGAHRGLPDFRDIVRVA